MNLLKKAFLTILTISFAMSLSITLVGCPPTKPVEETPTEEVTSTEEAEKTTKENEAEEETKDEPKVSPEDIIKAYYDHVDKGEFKQAYELLSSSFIPSRESPDDFAEGMKRAWAGAKVVSIQSIEEWFKQKDIKNPPSDTIATEDKKWFVVKVDMKWKKDWIPVVPEGVNTVFIEVVKEGNSWKISGMGPSY